MAHFTRGAGDRNGLLRGDRRVMRRHDGLAVGVGQHPRKLGNVESGHLACLSGADRFVPTGLRRGRSFVRQAARLARSEKVAPAARAPAGNALQAGVTMAFTPVH